MSERAASDAGALPPLAVIVVNWNGAAVLEDCLASLRDAGYPDLRVVVVDNGSTDGSAVAARARHPQIEFVETGRNLRWAGGNNVGLRHLADTGWRGAVLLLNNDTLVPENSLRRLVAALAQRPEA